jgi:hypothetical protein
MFVNLQEKTGLVGPVFCGVGWDALHHSAALAVAEGVSDPFVTG